MPSYICIQTAKTNSPALFALLDERQIRVRALNWIGDSKNPSIIWVHPPTDYYLKKLKKRCERFGHFLYDGRIKSPNEIKILEEIKQFLDKMPA